MKIAIAGLLSLLLAGCQHAVTLANSEVQIHLTKISSDARFTSSGTEQFRFNDAQKTDIKIIKYQFANQNEVKKYLLNRRMLLNRSFTDDVAPYFGLIKSEQSCLALVDIEGEFKSVDQNSEYFVMQLPINKNNVVLDCHQTDIWGLARYTFFNCKKQNEVFEVRYSRAIDQPLKSINILCE